jgi:uncharacterized protein (TIGR02444 family)
MIGGRKASEETMSVEFPAHPFWDFSLGVYKLEGVAPACLVVQERHGLDVNVLLYCCWLGASGRGVLTPGELDKSLSAAAVWHREIVRGVRAVRQRLKGGVPPAPRDLSDALRSRIAKIEVDLEHVEQLMLAAAVDRPENRLLDAERRAADAAANVGAYLAAVGARLVDDDRRQFAIILGAAFAAVSPDRIRDLCDTLKAAGR